MQLKLAWISSGHRAFGRFCFNKAFVVVMVVLVTGVFSIFWMLSIIKTVSVMGHFCRSYDLVIFVGCIRFCGSIISAVSVTRKFLFIGVVSVILSVIVIKTVCTVWAVLVIVVLVFDANRVVESVSVVETNLCL